MGSDLSPEHVRECGRIFRMIRVGGVWAIPRSGLVFQRTGIDTLTLTARMPHEEGMPVTREQLREQQESEYQGTLEHMQAAGITVTDSTKEQND